MVSVLAGSRFSLSSTAATAAQLLLEEGWAVSPGERYRFNTPPGIRITTTELAPKDSAKPAAALATALQSSQATYAA